ncbi:MAG: hypothetical protein HYW81_01130, partial [Parcubacteria group bacterium]|nr:hypothetical protein [Parcubacteria group bacterium]
MPKPIEEYRALVIAGCETVTCGCGFTGCEGEIPLDLAWHVCANLVQAFTGDEWKEVFPHGFDLHQLTVEHMEKRKLIVCDPCKREAEARCEQVKRDRRPSFLLLKKTVDDLTNGRFQRDKDQEADEERRRTRQVLDYLQGIPLAGGN